MSTSSLLTKQIQAETFPDGVPVRSRYLRVQQVFDWYPFKRAKLYEFLSSGKIKSFLLKERGALRGCRLIDRDSLDQFLQAAAEQAGKEAAV